MRKSLYFRISLLFVSLLFSAQANSANSFIEYSKMAHSDTLRDVNTLGFYTIFEHDTYFQYYAGIDLAMFEPNTAVNAHLSSRVALGISGLGTVAPYADIGTGLLDILFRGNNSTQNCNQQNNCEPNFYFRAGVRIGVTEHLTIGAFYEGVRFGNMQTNLTGSHSYTAVNIGFRY